MFQQLVNRNDDIRRLVEKGYAVAIDSNYLIVRDIPYLDSERRLQIGAIVTKLVFVDTERVTQDDHQIFFAGSVPVNPRPSIHHRFAATLRQGLAATMHHFFNGCELEKYRLLGES